VVDAGDEFAGLLCAGCGRVVRAFGHRRALRPSGPGLAALAVGLLLFPRPLAGGPFAVGRGAPVPVGVSWWPLTRCGGRRSALHPGAVRGLPLDVRRRGVGARSRQRCYSPQRCRRGRECGMEVVPR
jgi:hypothetical protein